MDKFLLTSTSNVEGYDIVEYIDFVTHQAVFSSNTAQELVANIQDATGGEGRSLADKLEDSAQKAMEEFREICQNKKANAVIGLRASYTNLSGNIAGVIISGTAVKIQEKQGTLKRDVNTLAVSNYINRKIVRPYEVDLSVDGSQVYMALKLYNYEMAKINAVKVDVTFTDVYGDATTVKNVDYTMDQDINIIIATDMIPVDLDATKIGLINDAKVTLKKYIKDRRVYDVKDVPIDSSLTSDELKIFKKNKGSDAVDKYRKTDTYWRCICGTINLPGDTQCLLCNREEKEFNSLYKFDYEAMLATMEDAQSAEDIKDILMQYIPYIDSGARVELLEILQSAINMEKTRGKGSMKFSILEKLKRKFELS